MMLACGICGGLGDKHVNAVLTVVIDNVIKFHGKPYVICFGVNWVVYLNRYDNYR